MERLWRNGAVRFLVATAGFWPLFLFLAWVLLLPSVAKNTSEKVQFGQLLVMVAVFLVALVGWACAVERRIRAIQLADHEDRAGSNEPAWATLAFWVGAFVGALVGFNYFPGPSGMLMFLFGLITGTAGVFSTAFVPGPANFVLKWLSRFWRLFDEGVSKKSD